MTNKMSENKKKGIILLVISILFFGTAINMYFFSDFFMSLFYPAYTADTQLKMILKYLGMFDALIGLAFFSVSLYFFKKDDGIK